jgi:2-polyprenyl-3-methyl-5-hydroxy-6-metoxy-1,4-benzoquinol methylase
MKAIAMALYDELAAYYDRVFAYNPAKAGFVLEALGDAARRAAVLEVGCATGDLALDLARHGEQVMGIDIEEEMLARARRKAVAREVRAEFRLLGMLDIDDAFGPNTFDAVTCFGNTLVHLDSTAQTGRFFAAAKQVLKADGRLMVQVLNYDRVYREKITHLPLIEDDAVRFQRVYELGPDRARVRFKTILTIKATGHAFTAETSLYPVGKDELVELLRSARFDDIRLFADYDRRPYRDEAFSIIIEAS